MKNLEAEPGGEQKKERGVLGYRIENDRYVVNVRWKDGPETERQFPVAGFDVVDPGNGNKHLGSIKGKDALKILQDHAGEYDHEEFSWRNFL